ncbi:MAG: hypothetical protein HN405_01835 [Planctomycetes bacterium]|jgi:hypothetical protein|nr:hypothetical protein [Planctomycetota bacterium]MBT4561075.1 hypothetical protein [Planctomycetota bacterium]MBT5100506.1 hypothetical protein [Planctomycetota bacterium]MBT7013088.1 hypothetical protein [Planctomycetota bacterium]
MNQALRFFFIGMGLVLARPRVLLLLVLVSLFMALPVAIPAWMSADTHLAHVSAYPGDAAPDFLHEVPGWLLDEWARADSNWRDLIRNGMAPALLLASLLGLLFAGGWMHSALHGRGEHGPAAFFRGGGSHFFPFVRTWLLGLPIFFGITWLIWSTPGEWVMGLFLPEGKPGMAASETTARFVEHGREILYVLMLLFTEAMLDVARADLVARDGRFSLWALLRAFLIMLRQPHVVMTLLGAGIILEGLWLVGIPAMVNGLHWPLWSLVLLIPLGRISMRGARWAGLALWISGRNHEPDQAAEKDGIPEVSDESEPPIMPTTQHGTTWVTDSVTPPANDTTN